jgi:hypothetical protein
VVEPDRGDGQDVEAALVDEEGVFVGAVVGAAVLDDAEPAGGDLFGDPVVEDDDAVGDVLFEPVAGEEPLAPFGGDDGGDALVLEPAEEAAQFGAEDGGVGEAREEGFEGVEHDALRPDRVDRQAEPDEQPLEVVLAGLLDLVPLNVDVVDGELVLADEVVEVVAEGADVLGEFLGGLLEGHEDAGLVVPDGAFDEEFDPEKGFAAPGVAADEGGPAPGEAAAGDLVEPVDAGRALFQGAGMGGLANHRSLLYQMPIGPPPVGRDVLRSGSASW